MLKNAISQFPFLMQECLMNMSTCSYCEVHISQVRVNWLCLQITAYPYPFCCIRGLSKCLFPHFNISTSWYLYNVVLTRNISTVWKSKHATLASNKIQQFCSHLPFISIKHAWISIVGKIKLLSLKSSGWHLRQSYLYCHKMISKQQHHWVVMMMNIQFFKWMETDPCFPYNVPDE